LAHSQDNIMALPLPANTTCDIYRHGVTPPAAPTLAAVPCVLQNDWRGGQAGRDRQANTLTWTHVLLVDAGVDIRDAYAGLSNLTPQDTVYIPDQSGTPYNVIFIEVVQPGSADTHKRVYLDRQQPNWGS
jgi:hypothetical protein